MFFVWELTWTQEPPPPLHCRFSVGFSPASEERLTVSLKPYTYEFQVENFFVCNIIGKWGVGWKHRARHGLDAVEVRVDSLSILEPQLKKGWDLPAADSEPVLFAPVPLVTLCPSWGAPAPDNADDT